MYFVDAWSMPTGKIEKNLFFHLLIGFDPEAQQSPDYWLTHLHKECAHEERETGGNCVAVLPPQLTISVTL